MMCKQGLLQLFLVPRSCCNDWMGRRANTKLRQPVPVEYDAAGAMLSPLEDCDS